MKKKKLGVAVLCITMCCCVVFLACPNRYKKLAEQTVAQAEMQVDEARRLAGPNYFSESFTKMEEFLAEAQKALELRNYSEAVNLGNQAIEYANSVVREVEELKKASERTGQPQEIIKRPTTVEPGRLK